MVSRRQLLVCSALAIGSSPLISLAGFLSPGPTSFVGDATFERLVAKATSSGWVRLPIGELIGRLGIELVGTPYVGHTLELDDHKEICAINLDGLDCVTFFECCLNLARILKEGKPTKEAFLAAVRFTRYRGGVQTDYTSRLHYTTDWIWDNVRKKTVRDLTPGLPGAMPFTQKVGFMSSNPDAYRQLKANPQLVPVIERYEEKINSRRMSYLPMEHVAAAEGLLQTGDIIGVATTEPGIDIAHTGLCYRDESGVLHFLDASSSKSKMKVTLDPELSRAIRWSTRNTGIVVARPLEPN